MQLFLVHIGKGNLLKAKQKCKKITSRKKKRTNETFKIIGIYRNTGIDIIILFCFIF